MKEIKIINSKDTEPKKEFLWKKGSGLKYFGTNGWESLIPEDIPTEETIKEISKKSVEESIKPINVMIQKKLNTTEFNTYKKSNDSTNNSQDSKINNLEKSVSNIQTMLSGIESSLKKIEARLSKLETPEK